MARKNPSADAYIDALPEWQQAVCHRVRELVLGVDPGIEEVIKRRVQPYYVLQGNVCALLATRDHVNVFLYDGALVPDPAGIITGGHGNSTARQISIYEGDQLDERAFTTMIAAIVANNRAGGWRAIRRRASPPAP